MLRPTALPLAVLLSTLASAQTLDVDVHALPAGLMSSFRDGVVIGDLDADGHIEVAALDPVHEYSGHFPIDFGSLWLGEVRPDGTLERSATMDFDSLTWDLFDTPSTVYDGGLVSLGDPDGDGGPDLLYGNGDGYTIIRFHADFSFKSYQTRDLAAAHVGFSPIGDRNGDGVQDVGWINPDTHRLAFHYLDAAGQVIGSATVTGVGLHNTHIRPLGDLDGNGVDDLVTGRPTRTTSNGGIQVLLMADAGTVLQRVPINPGQGGFAGPAEPNSFGASVSPAGDLNGDGTPDVLVTELRERDLWMLHLNPDGSVKHQRRFTDADLGHGPGEQFNLYTEVSVHDLAGGGIGQRAVYLTMHDEQRRVLFDALVPALASSRNGAGVNPDLLVSLSKPKLGQTWNLGLDLTGTGALFSTLNIGLGGPVDGPVPAFGQVLCLPPYLEPLVSTTNAHTFPLPANPALLGQSFSMQGFLWIPAAPQFLNAIDFTIGTY